MAMNEADYRVSHPGENDDGGDGKKPWFRPKAMGLGVMPNTWQGWVVLLGCVAILICVVVLFKTGVI